MNPEALSRLHLDKSTSSSNTILSLLGRFHENLLERFLDPLFFLLHYSLQVLRRREATADQPIGHSSQRIALSPFGQIFLDFRTGLTKMGTVGAAAKSDAIEKNRLAV